MQNSRSNRGCNTENSQEFCQFRRRVVKSVRVDVGDVAEKLFGRFIEHDIEFRDRGQQLMLEARMSPDRGQNLEAEAREFQGRGQKLEAEAKFLASRPVWPRGFNISENISLNVLYCIL